VGKTLRANPLAPGQGQEQGVLGRGKPGRAAFNCEGSSPRNSATPLQVGACIKLARRGWHLDTDTGI
jgi:hypothetical protein